MHPLIVIDMPLDISRAVVTDYHAYVCKGRNNGCVISFGSLVAHFCWSFYNFLLVAHEISVQGKDNPP